jgi:hypothetical protein
MHYAIIITCFLPCGMIAALLNIDLFSPCEVVWDGIITANQLLQAMSGQRPWPPPRPPSHPNQQHLQPSSFQMIRWGSWCGKQGHTQQGCTQAAPTAHACTTKLPDEKSEESTSSDSG